MNKISFQYSKFLIIPIAFFTQNFLFFSVNVIFDVFSIKRYILFIWANNDFLKKTDIDTNNLTFYIYWWLLINCLFFGDYYWVNVNLPVFIIKSKKERRKSVISWWRNLKPCINFHMKELTFGYDDLGMIFKQSFKCLKNEKIIFI